MTTFTGSLAKLLPGNDFKPHGKQDSIPSLPNNLPKSIRLADTANHHECCLAPHTGICGTTAGLLTSLGLRGHRTSVGAGTPTMLDAQSMSGGESNIDNSNFLAGTRSMNSNLTGVV